MTELFLYVGYVVVFNVWKPVEPINDVIGSVVVPSCVHDVFFAAWEADASEVIR